MKRILTALYLVIFGIFVALGLAEGLVRVFYPHAHDDVIPGRLFVTDDDLGWKLAPSKTGRHRTRYFDAKYITNSFGFRDKGRTAVKRPDIHRILLYADSFIFGWGVNDADLFSDVVESKKPGLEIWNHGISGYRLDQEILLYEREGASVNADEAIFFVGPNTLKRIDEPFLYAKYKPMFVRQEDGRLVLLPVPKGNNAAIGMFYAILIPFYLPYLERQSKQTRCRATHGAARAVTHNGYRPIGQLCGRVSFSRSCSGLSRPLVAEQECADALRDPGCNCGVVTDRTHDNPARFGHGLPDGVADFRNIPANTLTRFGDHILNMKCLLAGDLPGFSEVVGDGLEIARD
jgi:hypothetical protein